jgi:hypothetical protein
MSTFEFNHELVFGPIFDSSVITNSEIEDKDSTFIDVVQAEFDKINNILSLYSGVTVMSSFVEHNSRRYKVTVRK